MSTATVTCGNCRHEHAATALFCPHCGRAKVRDDGDALLGKILGERFVVQERLGQGASGAIYRAEHVTLRRKVAIKVLHHELSRDDLAIERFRREATTVADIDNEHIVEIHDFGRAPDGRLYLAMELLDGETLDAVLGRERRLDVDRAIDIMTQVGEALIEAHAIGYVHRDLRPRNIFLAQRRTRANFVKLLDFGLSKLVETEGQAASTSLGMTFGDPRYMSPEQARGDAIDRRADIYQLGCVAYEMLTGSPPFVGGRVFDVLSRHVSEAPVPVTQARPDVPAWLAACVMRMLAKRPDERFATMTRMVEALRQGAATGTVMEEATARQEEAEPPPSVSRVMQKLGRTALGPHGDGAEAPAAVAAAPAPAPAVVTAAPEVSHPPEVQDTAPTQTMRRIGPRGTPKVGVPAVGAEAPVGDEPAVADEPAGKRAGVPRPGRASDSAGISSVWYADGDKLDGGADLDDSQAARLDRARRLIAPLGESMSDGYAPAQRPIGKLVAIGAGALLLLVVLVVVVAGGGSSGDQPADARAGAPPVAPDAAGQAAFEAAPDAGVVEPAVAPPDAAPATRPATRPPKDDGATTVRRPKEPTDPGGGGTGRTDPLDPVDKGGGAVDDEAKAKAEFFAKAGESQLRGGDPQAAAASFKKALEQDPKNLAAIIGLGEVAMQQGLYDAALSHLKKAAKMSPRSSRVHTLLGESYLNSGNEKSAEASFKKALQLDPDNERARNGYNEAASRLPPPQDDP